MKTSIQKILVSLMIIVIVSALYLFIKKEFLEVILFLIILIFLMMLWFTLEQKIFNQCIFWLQHNAEIDKKPKITGKYLELIAYIERLVRINSKNNQKYTDKLELLLRAFKSTPNGIILLDPKYQIEWMNDKAAEYMQFDQEKDHMQHITNLIREPHFNAYLKNKLNQDSIEIKSSDGLLHLSVLMKPYDKKRWFLLLVNITEKELVDKMKKDFVANMSHEIKTPITVLSGFIENLQQHDLSQAEKDNALKIMQGEIERMKSLVSGLLTLANLEKDIQPDYNHWTTVSSIFDYVEDVSNQISCNKHNITFINTADAKIAGSRNELLSALSNVVTNSIYYTPEGGSITVTWQITNDQKGQFIIEDTGIGIPKHQIERVTERFYRINQSRHNNIHGTGLGLSIVKHILLRHDGNIIIDSEYLKGTKITLIFPSKRIKLLS